MTNRLPSSNSILTNNTNPFGFRYQACAGRLSHMFYPRLIFCLVLMFTSLSAYPQYARSEPQPVGYYANAHKEIKAIISSKKDITNFNRIIGMISDLLRIHRQESVSTHKGGRNEIAAKVEDLLNEASMFASQDDFDKSYKSLDDALEVIIDSLHKLPGHREH